MPFQDAPQNLDGEISYTIFTDEITAILRGERLAISGLIAQWLRQFRLNRQGVTVEDVISEVYVRTLPKIASGTIVYRPAPWIKSVAYRYIRELSRKHKKELSLLDEASVDVQQDYGEDTSFADEIIQRLKKAISKLEPVDSCIVYSHYFQNKSWKETKEILNAAGIEITESALRKRAERIRHKLRADMKAD